MRSPKNRKQLAKKLRISPTKSTEINPKPLTRFQGIAARLKDFFMKPMSGQTLPWQYLLISILFYAFNLNTMATIDIL